MKSPLGAHRITEQPRRHDSSVKYIRDPMTQGYQPGGGLWVMWHVAKEIVSEPRTVPPCFSIYHLDHGHITLQTPPVTHAPRASSVQVDCPIAACVFA